MKYKILEYIEATHTIVVEYNDDENCRLNFDLPVDINGKFPDNQEIDRLIMVNAPLSREDRIQHVDSTQVNNIRSLVGLQKDFTPLEAITPPPLPIPDIENLNDPLVNAITSAEKINSVVI